MARLARIPLVLIGDEAISYTGDVDGLDPEDTTEAPVIVEVGRSGGYSIVDGMHRTSGMVAWAAERDLDLAEVIIPVVLVDENDDEDLISDAAEPGVDQEEAIEEIYRQAGL